MEKYIKDHSDSYLHIEHCSNCGHPNMIMIPKGVRVDSAMQDKDCSACGCSIRRGNHRDYNYGKDRVWMQANDRKAAASLAQLPGAPTHA